MHVRVHIAIQVLQMLQNACLDYISEPHGIKMIKKNNPKMFEIINSCLESRKVFILFYAFFYARPVLCVAVLDDTHACTASISCGLCISLFATL